MISYNNQLVTKISYGKENVEAVYKGNKKIWPIDMDGVIIDQTDTSDPDKIFKGETMNEELVSIAKDVHWYCGKLTEKGMLICQIGDNVVNFNPLSTNIRPTTFYDGKTSTTTRFKAGFNPYSYYGDIFLRFPTFSVINNVIDDNHCQIKWVHGVKVPGWVTWDDTWLIGLSSCSYQDFRFFCHEDVHGYDFFENYKSRLEEMNNMECMKNVNGKYGFFMYWQRCILTYLYWSFYGTTRDVLSGDPHYFFGIDAFCSSWQEFLDGIVVNNRIPTITRPDGTTRIGPKLPGDTGTTGGYISKIHLTPYLDIIPKEYGASSNSGFCSGAWASSLDGCIPRMKGGNGFNEVVGCGYDRNPDDHTASNNQHIRLTYHGDIIETKDIEYFKRVKPINGGVYFDDETGQDEICLPQE